MPETAAHLFHIQIQKIRAEVASPVYQPGFNNVAAPRLRSGRLVPGLETLTRATAGNSDFAKRNASRPSPASVVIVSAKARPDLRILVNWVTFSFMIASVARGQENNPLIGIWAVDEVFQILEFLFCSNGRYQLDTTNPDPVAGYTVTERGRYEINGQALTLTPYDFLSSPQDKHYEFQVSGNSLSLTRLDFPQSHVCQLKTGSRADVLARENVDPVLVRTWERSIEFFGKVEYTFRPGGYYFLKNIHENSEQFPPEFIRGRYEQDGTRLTIKPYSGVETQYEIDFFGNTLTLIRNEGTFGESATYEALPGSEADVRAKADEAEAFLRRPGTSGSGRSRIRRDGWNSPIDPTIATSPSPARTAYRIKWSVGDTSLDATKSR